MQTWGRGIEMHTDLEGGPEPVLLTSEEHEVIVVPRAGTTRGVDAAHAPHVENQVVERHVTIDEELEPVLVAGADVGDRRRPDLVVQKKGAS